MHKTKKFCQTCSHLQFQGVVNFGIGYVYDLALHLSAISFSFDLIFNSMQSICRLAVTQC